MRRRRRQLEATEFADLVRLIARRPDAESVFEAAGRRLGSEYLARSARAPGAVRRLAPQAIRRRSMLRHLRRVAEALSPGSSISSEKDPPALALTGCLPAAADDTGTACAMITGAFAACLVGLGQAGIVRHATCESRGDVSCTWEVPEP